MGLATVVVILVLGIPLVAVAGFFLVWAVKVGTGGSSGKRDKAMADETQLIQELHQGLRRMEERIESLETILFDRERKEREK